MHHKSVEVPQPLIKSPNFYRARNKLGYKLKYHSPLQNYNSISKYSVSVCNAVSLKLALQINQSLNYYSASRYYSGLMYFFVLVLISALIQWYSHHNALGIREKSFISNISQIGMLAMIGKYGPTIFSMNINHDTPNISPKTRPTNT